MTAEGSEALINYLRQFTSESRWNRFKEVIQERTNHICVVLENVYQAHNASAVIRSCDCFGIQNVHLIESKHALRISDHVAVGSSKWITLNRHKTKHASATEVLNKLKQKGYRIVATTPHTSTTIHELDVAQPFALVFGTEKEGISNEVNQLADEFVRIPMYGFTESYNISVSAALCLYELSQKIRQQKIDFQLKPDEQQAILYKWLCSSIEKSDLLIQHYLDKINTE